MLDLASALIAEHPFPIGVGLAGLVIWGWHRFVSPIEFRSSRPMWEDEIADEREQDHAKRSKQLASVVRISDRRLRSGDERPAA